MEIKRTRIENNVMQEVICIVEGKDETSDK